MKTILPDVKALLDSGDPVEPVIVITITWPIVEISGPGGPWRVPLGENNGLTRFSDRHFKKYGFSGKIMSLSNIDNIVNIDGNTNSGSISVILDDTDNTLKNLIERVDIHNSYAVLHLFLTELGPEQSIYLFDGVISSPIVYKEHDKTLSFDIVTQLDDYETSIPPSSMIPIDVVNTTIYQSPTIGGLIPDNNGNPTIPVPNPDGSFPAFPTTWENNPLNPASPNFVPPSVIPLPTPIVPPTPTPTPTPNNPNNLPDDGLPVIPLPPRNSVNNLGPNYGNITQGPIRSTVPTPKIIATTGVAFKDQSAIQKELADLGKSILDAANNAQFAWLLGNECGAKAGELKMRAADAEDKVSIWLRDGAASVFGGTNASNESLASSNRSAARSWDQQAAQYYSQAYQYRATQTALITQLSVKATSAGEMSQFSDVSSTGGNIPILGTDAPSGVSVTLSGPEGTLAGTVSGNTLTLTTPPTNLAPSIFVPDLNSTNETATAQISLAENAPNLTDSGFVTDSEQSVLINEPLARKKKMYFLDVAGRVQTSDNFKLQYVVDGNIRHVNGVYTTINGQRVLLPPSSYTITQDNNIDSTLDFYKYFNDPNNSSSWQNTYLKLTNQTSTPLTDPQMMYNAILAYNKELEARAQDYSKIDTQQTITFKSKEYSVDEIYKIVFTKGREAEALELYHEITGNAHVIQIQDKYIWQAVYATLIKKQNIIDNTIATTTPSPPTPVTTVPEYIRRGISDPSKVLPTAPVFPNEFLQMNNGSIIGDMRSSGTTVIQMNSPASALNPSISDNITVVGRSTPGSSRIINHGADQGIPGVNSIYYLLQGVYGTDFNYTYEPQLIEPTGVNPVSVIADILTRFTDLAIDIDSFNRVHTQLSKVRMNFNTPDKKNALQLIGEIAFQACCAIYIKFKTIYIINLRYKSPPVDTITYNDILPGSLELHFGNSEQMITKAVAKFRALGQTDDYEITLRYNERRYGTREQSYDYFAFNDADQVTQSLRFWLLRKANTYKFVKFRTPLHKIWLENYDRVRLSFPDDPFGNGSFVGLADVEGLIIESIYDSEKKEMIFTVWCPIRMGSRLRDSYAEPYGYTQNYPHSEDKDWIPKKIGVWPHTKTSYFAEGAQFYINDTGIPYPPCVGPTNNLGYFGIVQRRSGKAVGPQEYIN